MTGSSRDKSAPPSSVWRVAKFGGTSVLDASALAKVGAIVAAAPKGLAVVLSAMGGVTDLLLGAADAATRGGNTLDAQATFRKRHLDLVQTLVIDPGEKERLTKLIEASAEEFGAICQGLRTLRETTRRTLDTTAARGERLLAQIFAAYARSSLGVDAVYVDSPGFLKVERQYGSLFPDLAATTRGVAVQVVPHLKAGATVVVPGYIGTGPEGELVTLGRGGSDLSATVLGHALEASLVSLYKEVDGLLTADPRYVTEARIVPELHYREAAELAYYGAKVLHPRTIIPLLTHKIPLVVRSTFNPEQPGTRIAGDVPPGAFPVKALTAIMGQAMVALEGSGMIGVPGIAGRAFGALAQAGISVSMISQASSEASLCFTVPDTEAKTAVAALKETFRFEIDHRLVEDVRVKPKLAVVAVVGLGMRGTHGIAARVFGALAKADANVEAIAQGSSELNISVVIAESHVQQALKSLHREFRLEKLRALPQQHDGDVRFAVHGVGQVGRTVLKQYLAQRGYYLEKMDLDLRCLALADRSGLLVEESGFDTDKLTEHLTRKETGVPLVATPGNASNPPSLAAALKERLWQLPIKKGIFVDLTADDTAPLVEAALSAGWSVVLANKKPLAIPQADFDRLFAIAADKGVHLRYEATVGAGLPILDTLAKLAEAGDDVKSIAGCFSGTLGFLMTELEDGTPFSEAVRRAHALGYTEPDPREDLSGMDVARKGLILARTLGRRLDLADVKVEALFPEAASDPNPSVFIDNLRRVDADWKTRIETARQDGKALRYVASIDDSGVTVGIQAVPKDSTLGRLRGTDNQVAVTTRRYDKQPLVVTGPGAGAEVTAAGVLNDIVAIAAAAERTQRLRGGKS
jgi:aspartokinase/homoserine dehydrogenase 1